MRQERSSRDAALLVARGVLGGSIAAHGAQKLFGWFGGPGIDGATQMFSSLGFRPADSMARAASLAELLSGALIATGAGGPVGPAMLTGVMAVAAGSVHWKNGYFATNKGFELNTLYAVCALLLAVEDHGRFSVDEATGLREYVRPSLGWLALAGGIGAAAAILWKREQEPAPDAQAPSQTEKVTLDAPAANITPATQ
jgi:putative oxidoreductase